MIKINSRKTRLLGASAMVRYVGLALSVCAPLVSVQAQTLPTGGTVVAGAASLSTTGNTLTVNQVSQKAVLNWQGFSIGKGDAVVFSQPNSNAVALNRVTGADATSIMGSLSANGQV